MIITKRSIITVLLAVAFGGGLGTAASSLVSPADAQSAAISDSVDPVDGGGATYGHQHTEPDNSVFCHCGTGNCTPCG